MADFIAKINDNLLVRNRTECGEQEAWIIFSPGKATIATDIHAQGGPHNAIAFTAAELRHIADMIPEDADG